MYKTLPKRRLLWTLLIVGCSSADDQAQWTQSQDSLAISPTAVYQIKSAATGKCIGIVGNSTANSAKVEERTCNGSTGQKFTIATVATGYYAIKNTTSLKCLDVNGKSTADGTAIIQYTCNNSSTNQQWAIAEVSPGIVRFTAHHSGKVAEVNQGGTADGTTLVQRAWNGANYQQFQLSTGTGTAADAGAADVAATGGTASGGSVATGGTASGGSVATGGTGGGGATASGGTTGAGGSTATGGTTATGGSTLPPVIPCTTNRLSQCSGNPLACHFGGNPGNYEVTVQLGGPTAGETEVEAEYYRRMLTQTTAANTPTWFSFVTNVRVYEGEPARPDQDGVTSKGIPGLDVYFRGTAPQPISICYQLMAKPVMLWLEGDSTVTDQEDPAYAGWGQHLPQHFVSPISVANYADSGESSGSVLSNAKLWPTVRAGMKPGDWVMVQLGHNDKTTPAATYKANMLKMVNDTKAAGAHMILVTPTSRVGYTLAEEHVNQVGANLPQIIRDLGQSENVPVIDLTVTTWNWIQTINWPDYYANGTDHTHTNQKGADVISGFVRDAVRAQIPALATYLR
jgi:lysophospholipase L1-like esterase